MQIFLLIYYIFMKFCAALYLSLIHIFGSPNAVGYNMGPTNTLRDDVNNTYGVIGNHGYDFIITTDKRGAQPVYVYALSLIHI